MSGIGRGGTGTLTVDGKVVATQKMERTVPLILPVDETFDVGSKPVRRLMIAIIKSRSRLQARSTR
jgi:hypothetical protein